MPHSEVTVFVFTGVVNLYCTRVCGSQGVSFIRGRYVIMYRNISLHYNIIILQLSE